MTTIQNSKPWDLSHVLDLVNALSSPKAIDEHSQDDYLSVKQARDNHNGIEQKDFAKGANLGDFGRIWQVLGVTEPAQKQETSFATKDDYTSDGAIRYGVRSDRIKKKVTWKEDTSADELATETEYEHTPTPAGGAQKLNKNQRKKQNRRARKALPNTPGTVSESEAESAYFTTPARKASTHVVPPVPADGRHKLRSRSLADGLTTATSKEASAQQPQPSSPAPTRPEASARQRSEPIPIASTAVGRPSGPQWPVPAPPSTNTAFLPASVAPKASTPQGARETPTSRADAAAVAVKAFQAAQATLSGSPAPRTTPATLPKRQTAIEPKIVRSGEDRNWALLLKLINEYPETRKHLVAPMNMTTHNNDPAGIHIFVDASNIFIGFNDQLKIARNIPLTARLPHVDLSFDALALLMERRRPVAKRVLVGSTPHMPAFDKAKAVGYECNILEKVYKAKELTDRQIYFRDVGRQNRRAKASLPSTSPSNGFWSTDDYSGGGGASGSETTTGPQYAPAKMIEQGVDEILHLKILESVVDSDQPATMVIATGDAAQAEYSDGFMAMTLRALKKGWRVELVSWSKNISSLYNRKSFRDTWGDNFRIISLDDYAEELLDM